jgi:hypothetical protein
MLEESNDDESRQVDNAADPLGGLYNNIEKRNHDAVAFVVSHGYKLATEKLKASICRVTAAQAEG